MPVYAAALSARGTESIQNKLNHIIIPKIEFRDATVREAVDFLTKSRELDTDESDPSRRGVNIVLKLEPGQNVTSTIQPNDARITLSLTNIPLIEALRYVTNLTGSKVKVDQYAVVIVPLSEPADTLITNQIVEPPPEAKKASGLLPLKLE